MPHHEGPRSPLLICESQELDSKLTHHVAVERYGTYVVEFKTTAGEALAISVPRNETAAIRHFQERMPYGLFVPDVP